jgi:hypothetical protein
VLLGGLCNEVKEIYYSSIEELTFLSLLFKRGCTPTPPSHSTCVVATGVCKIQDLSFITWTIATTSQTGQVATLTTWRGCDAQKSFVHGTAHDMYAVGQHIRLVLWPWFVFLMLLYCRQAVSLEKNIMVAEILDDSYSFPTIFFCFRL